MQGSPILETNLPLPLFGRGKVRDTYDLGSELLIIATDRITAFDSILPTGIPYKGQVLTALSAFWFRFTAGTMPNHLITTDRRQFPFDWRAWPRAQQEQLRGRAMLVKKAEPIAIECVARGYLAGPAWAEYEKTGRVVGLTLPHGLEPSQQLSQPIFTPILGTSGEHDEHVSFEQVVELFGQARAEQLRDATLKIYGAVAEHARQRGTIVADTRLEFGMLDGQLIVIDEMVTPDSSRLWEVRKYRYGENQLSHDKQYVRDWLLKSGWNREAPAPALPHDVVQKTSEKYLEAYKHIVGRDLPPELDTQ